jgi:cytochrome c heme-lyase
MAGEQQSDAEACPVDHKTRAAWLQQAQSQSPPPSLSTSTTGKSCSSNEMDQSISSSSRMSPHSGSLPKSRVISSIPRTPLTPQTSPSAPAANNEQETGTSASGNWIYPSEHQFFEALKRKNFKARVEDMATIVPIHNAVNERAWKEVLEWESSRGGDKCGGPKLASFSGKTESMTPKAWLNTLLGYSAPFDRHDWVIDRCGTRVEYVIDFYEGKNERVPGKPLNFYLDVRPKLNTWEGCRMRLEKMVGL